MKERFEALDAWRGICALIVALEHLQISGVLHHNALVHHGYRFVDFFFVLSGFVIAHAYRDRLQAAGGTRAYMIRRIGRLWPLHAVILAVLVGFELAILVGGHVGISIGRPAFTDRDTLATLPFNLALVHAWGFLRVLTWNTPSWSISAELFAYGAFAVICLVPRRALDGVAAVLVVASAIVICAVAPLGMKSTYDFGLARCVFGFMTGVLVRALWARRPIAVGTIGEIVVVVVVLAGVILLPDGWPALFVTPLFALAVWSFAGESGVLSRQLKRAAPQALGAWSYSLYMVHAVVMLALLTGAMMATKAGLHLFARVDNVASIVGPPWLTTIITIAYLAIIIGLARFTYRRIELAGQRWFARFTKRRFK